MELVVGKQYKLSNGAITTCVMNDLAARGKRLAVFVQRQAFDDTDRLYTTLADGTQLVHDTKIAGLASVLHEYVPPMKVRVIVARNIHGRTCAFSATEEEYRFSDRTYADTLAGGQLGFTILGDVVVEVPRK